MAFLDTIRLGFGGNLIMGNTTDKILLNFIAEKHIKEEALLQREGLESFGLFDSSQPNYTTYYPDVTAEDLAPKEADFIQPVFRALSEVVVHKEWNPVDFSMNGVLKKSTPLLKGQTVNVDHETATGNAMGAVKDVMWEESYKQGNITIPAGINARFKIDGKSNPRIARGILMDPPSIHSTSVTVQFLWEKSHEMPEGEFFSKLGSYDKDGKLIRRIANQVKKYNEISLVPHGADPFAQLIKDGGLINPKYADITYNTVKPEYKQKQSFFFFDFKSDVIKNAENNSIPKNSNDNNSSQTEGKMKKIWITLAALCAVKFADPENPTEAEYTELENKLTAGINENAANRTTIANNATELTRLQALETEYNTNKVALAEAIPLKTFKENSVKELRAKVTKAVTLLNNNTMPVSLADVITNASYETLVALDQTYSAQLDEKIPLSCKSCGSKDINRASAKPGQPEETENSEKDPIQTLLRSRQNTTANQMHGMPIPEK